MTSPQNTTPPPTTTPEPATLANQTEPKNEPKAEPPKAADAPKPADASAAPEKYEDYKVPEGFALDPEIKKEADAIFKGMSLSQDQAQSLVDFYVAKTKESAEQPYAAYKEMTDGWRDESLKHPDIGNKILPGGEVSVRIARALDSLGDPKLASDFRGLMDLTGAGNHQAFIRVIDKLASRAVEGNHVAGNAPAKAGQSEPGKEQVSAAQAMYPNLPSGRGG